MDGIELTVARVIAMATARIVERRDRSPVACSSCRRVLGSGHFIGPGMFIGGVK